MKFGLKKLETSLYRTVEKYFDILNRLCVDHECDRRTYKQNGLYQYRALT